MFEQVAREQEPSGGAAISLTLLHQFIATPGTLLVALPLAAFVELAYRETHSHSVCLGVAVLVGCGIGYVFPHRAAYGYWSWVGPTAFFMLIFWTEVGLHNSSFTQQARKAFYPDDNSIDFTLGTMPWLQSFFYSFGLRLGVKYKREKSAPP